MRIRELECFQAIMTAGTMTRAAQLLNLSQPAVSNAISILENRLGFSLFQRRAGRVIPTPEAHQFYEDTIRMLEIVDRTQQAATRIRQGTSGHLKISAFPSISLRFLPQLINNFRIGREDVKIQLSSRSSRAVLEQIPNQTFDIALAENPVGYESVKSEIFEYTCECIIPSGHALCERDYITPEDLAGVPFASLFRDHMTNYQIAKAFADAGKHWNVVLEAEYFASVCEFVGLGNAVGIVDPLFSRDFDDGCVRKPFSPPILYQIGLMQPKDRVSSLITQNFVEKLRAALFQESKKQQVGVPNLTE